MCVCVCVCVRTLGIWGPKGCGKSFNIELCCKKLDIQPIIVSAGELEDGTAGEPGKVRHQSHETRGHIPIPSVLWEPITRDERAYFIHIVGTNHTRREGIFHPYYGNQSHETRGHIPSILWEPITRDESAYSIHIVGTNHKVWRRVLEKDCRLAWHACHMCNGA